ncbi:MAG: glycine cleavage system protein GcvH [Chloroflexi bacterium]|nr:glycine cleavage system protein GcvH [Chloroflexota bacterium]MCL5074536.1 glycine cleavage system protein GcvH [Chloroflexota bacterium]
MDFPRDLRYTKEHEWVRLEDGHAVIGITDYAQSQLGDVVYVELPSVGSEVKQFATFGVVESVKTASDLYCPLSGRVTAVNERLQNEPELVNQDPYGAGWMIEVEIAAPDELTALLTAEEYERSLPTG